MSSSCTPLDTGSDRRSRGRVTEAFAHHTGSGHGPLIARDPRIRIRDIAALLDIPERASQRIVADLVTAGYIDSERQGRRNVYSVRVDRPFNLPFQRDIDINALLGILAHVGDPGVGAAD